MRSVELEDPQLSTKIVLSAPDFSEWDGESFLLKGVGSLSEANVGHTALYRLIWRDTAERRERPRGKSQSIVQN